MLVVPTPLLRAKFPSRPLDGVVAAFGEKQSNAPTSRARIYGAIKDYNEGVRFELHINGS